MPRLTARIRFARIPSKTHELGWRFSRALPAHVVEAISAFTPMKDLARRFSRRRKVKVPAFEIAKTALPFRDVLGDPYELEGVVTLKGLCGRIDARLAADGLRLPTEDELEAAAGGSLFAWGLDVPDGVPYGSETSFKGHKKPNAFGLTLNSDPYKVEVCRHALKLGDGGSSICGGEPWPMAWLPLSPAFRLRDSDIAECFLETLEQAFIRPVKRA